MRDSLTRSQVAYMITAVHYRSNCNEDKNRSATQEISRFLCNLKVYYSTDKSPLLFPVLSHMNVVQNLIPSLRYILVLSSYLRLDVPRTLLPSGSSFISTEKFMIKCHLFKTCLEFKPLRTTAKLRHVQNNN